MRPGLTDRQIREATGIEPHRTVNQVCRKLVLEGLLVRHEGPDGLIVNVPTGDPRLPQGNRRADYRIGENPLRSVGPPATKRRVWSRTASPHRTVVEALRVDPARTLFVIPCSGASRGGTEGLAGAGVLNRVSPGSADRLRARRQRVASKAAIDATLRPAWQRYDGGLYTAAAHQIGRALDRGVDIAIVSGGHGVCLATEPIGWYDARFSPGDWGGMVADVLSELAADTSIRSVVGVFGAPPHMPRRSDRFAGRPMSTPRW